MRKMNIRFTLALLALLPSLACAQQNPWPNKPVRIVSIAPPGGAIDLLARFVAEEASKTFNQPFIVENRPGANGNIGAQAVLREPPEGYFFFVGPPGPFSINASIMSGMTFNPATDIAPVAMLGVLPLALVVHPAIPANNLQELLAWMKTRAGKVTYASQGSASTGHLAMELFLSATGLEAIHIPYKNSGTAAALDQIAGRIDVSFNSTGSTLAYLAKGQLRAIGVAELKRISAAPNMPTLAEQGLPGFEVTAWLGMGTRSGVPGDIIRRMNEVSAQAIARPENRDRLLKLGLELRTMTPEQFTAYVRAETVKWGDLVKRTGAKAD